MNATPSDTLGIHRHAHAAFCRHSPRNSQPKRHLLPDASSGSDGTGRLIETTSFIRPPVTAESEICIIAHLVIICLLHETANSLKAKIPRLPSSWYRAVGSTVSGERYKNALDLRRSVCPPPHRAGGTSSSSRGTWVLPGAENSKPPAGVRYALRRVGSEREGTGACGAGWRGF